MKRIFKVMWESKEILLLWICYILFFGWTGSRLFKGQPEGASICPDQATCTWQILITMTTANYPDVSLDAYGVNRAYVLFFLLYMILGLFFLLNLVLAVIYSNYSYRLSQQSEEFEDKREEFLVEKFHLADKVDPDRLTHPECKDLLMEMLNLQGEPSNLNLNNLVQLIDSSEKGYILEDDFTNLYEAID